MFAILALQAIGVALFTTFITFRVMGSNYEAAALVGGQCGFGLGATPTAIANMQAIDRALRLRAAGVHHRAGRRRLSDRHRQRDCHQRLCRGYSRPAVGPYGRRSAGTIACRASIGKR